MERTLLDPSHPRCSCRRRWRTAIRRFSRSLTDAATYDSRGLIHLKMGQFDTAIDDYNSALRSEPKLASALYGRGLAKLKNGDVAGSKADISAAKTIQAEDR